MSGAGSLADVADELYAGTPDRFTAERDAASRGARESGDRELAAQIKALRRPTVGTWLVNQVMRSGDDAVDELFDLGASLRKASDSFDGVLLRTLSRQRPHVVRALTEVAGRLAAEAGQNIADQALRDFESTLDAALADEDAADAVRSGRLMRTLTSSGLEAVDLTGAVAAPEALSRQHPTRPKAAKKTVERSATKATKKTTEQPSRRPPERAPKPNRPSAAHRAAERALTQARERVEQADADVGRREHELDEARVQVETLRDRVGELEAELERVNADRTRAEQTRREADKARREAVREREAARRAAGKAESDLERAARR